MSQSPAQIIVRVRQGLRRRESWLQLAQFCLVGASGYAINLCAFAFALGLLTANHLLAAAVAFTVAVANNFWWNYRYTFADSEGSLRSLAARFFAVSLLAFAFATALLDLMVRGGVPALAAQALSIASATPLNFIVNRLWTFSRVPDVVYKCFDRRSAARHATGVWLILPTYNEAHNIERLVQAAIPCLSAAAPAHRVLIVDDRSPDGTGHIADRLARRFDSVEVLHRSSKDGLGRAYLAGFERAIADGADLIIEMDSDFSHDPRDLPRLIASTRDVDLAIGSRYVPGGAVADWSLARRLLSRAGSWYARTILGVPVRDLTSGFKCFRRPVIEYLADSGAATAGYGFQIEMTYRALRAGYRVDEVPIVFHDRVAGKSKMNTRIALEALWQVPRLKLRTPSATQEQQSGRHPHPTGRFQRSDLGSSREPRQELGSH